MQEQTGSDESSDSRQEFAFISTTQPGKIDASTRRRIRSHVRADQHRRNNTQRQPSAIRVNVTPLLDRSLQSLPEPATPFDLDENRRSHQLWNHIHDGTCAKFRALVAIGFIDLVRNTIAISQVLSAAAWHLVYQLNFERDRGEHNRYSMMTAQSLQQRLNSHATSTTDEVIITVLASAAFANLVQDSRLFNIHMSGLSHVLHERGNNNERDLSPTLKLAIFWIEVDGRFQQDSAPQFPFPYQILSSQSRLNLLNGEYGLANEISGAIQSNVNIYQTRQNLRELHEIIHAELLTRRDLWQEALFPIYNLLPILYNLLSARRFSIHDEFHLRQEECFRLAAILYINNIRTKFGFEPGGGMLHGSKLQMMLNTDGCMSSWGQSNILLIWILTVAASSPTLFAELRGYFVERLQEHLRASGIEDFETYVNLLREFAWIDEVFGGDLRVLQDQIKLSR
ncbi:hypothetical protein F5884DRAFT_894521 [Xylogone sp. PMI_703]|nr:hypothetical protein F5884DRAFT_894521 [Xylogone sp. PMI_703]